MQTEVQKKRTTAPSRPRRRSSMPISHALVTGYPGFIGRRLAHRLLEEHRGAQVTLLVQEKFKERADAELAELPQGQRRRAHILVGDVAKMDLGLSGPEIEALTKTVSHVFHLAAVQYLGIGESEAYRVNVGGTRNMLMLAREMEQLKRFVHFSSCYVSGDRIGVITEDELDLGQTFRNSYERTKFEAERLVRTYVDNLPITILRPSIVVGHSETGEIDRFDGIYGMGILVVTSPISIPLPLPGDGVAPLNVVPVDFVTKAALKLATMRETEGKTFHLVDPNPLSSRHVYELIAMKVGKRIPRVRISYGLTRRLLRMPLIEKFSRTPAQALDYLNHLAIYNCSNTLTYLEGTGILCPRIDTYVDRLMSFVKTQLKQEEGKEQRLIRARKDPFAA